MYMHMHFLSFLSYGKAVRLKSCSLIGTGVKPASVLTILGVLIASYTKENDLPLFCGPYKGRKQAPV